MLPNMPIKSFIDQILPCESVNEILRKFTNGKNKQDTSLVKKSLWNLMFKCGMSPLFPNSEYSHIYDSDNKYHILNDYDAYFDNPISSTPDHIIILNEDNPGIDEYMIIMFLPEPNDNDPFQYYNRDSMKAQIENVFGINKGYSLYLISDIKSMTIPQSHTPIINPNQIFDSHDLNIYFRSLVDHVRSFKSTNLTKLNYNELFHKLKPKISMRFHQELIMIKTCQLIQSGENNSNILWGCKCRCGKTYIAGKTIVHCGKTRDKFNVIIISPAPTETIPQFTDDLLLKYRDFDKFDTYQLTSSLISQLPKIKFGPYNIFVVSKQVLQRYTGKDQIDSLVNLGIDMIIYDENHFSGTTEISQEILKTYVSSKTTQIFLTATFNKPIKAWDIPSNCQLFWTLEDEHNCKSIKSNYQNIDILREKYGANHVDRVLNTMFKAGHYLGDIFAIYQSMPNLCLMTNMFDAKKYAEIKRKISDTSDGFSFSTLFSLTKSKKQFNFPDAITFMLRYISGSNKAIDFPAGDKSIFGRIYSNPGRDPFTQIWFLPPDNINKISVLLMKLMNLDPVLKEYEILCVNRQSDTLDKDVKDQIVRTENKAIKAKKRGVILLAGNMLSLGISIPKCDIVILMNNSKSSDRVMQQMFRCMTEGTNKPTGYVVDMDVCRVLNTCIDYGLCNDIQNIPDKIKFIIENHLIDIDADLISNKQIDARAIVNKLMDIWRGSPASSFDMLFRGLKNEKIVFDDATDLIVNNMFGTLDIKHDKSNLNTVVIMDPNDPMQTIGTGRKAMPDTDVVDDEFDEPDDGPDDIDAVDYDFVDDELDDPDDVDAVDYDFVDDEQEIPDDIKVNEPVVKNIVNPIDFSKDVFPQLTMLIALLNIDNELTDIGLMIDHINNTVELLEVFDEQCGVWWGKTGMIGDIIKIIKAINKKSNANNIILSFRMGIKLLDDPEKLVTFINDRLKPKDIEKRKFGEVFTPLPFINNNMLKDLDTHYQTTHDHSIWSNPNLKFFDPAAGIGNFPVMIYYKLLEGLATHMPDPNVRKKHIIEKMLYMSEISKKNCYIVKKIFGMGNNCNCNMNIGDSLKLDIQAKFGMAKFDVIIGNPPYNKEIVNKNSVLPLYNEFIEYYIDKCDILTFVVPSRWFAGGKGLKEFRHNMLNRKDIVYINHFKDASDIFGKDVDISGGVNYFLKDAAYTRGITKFNGTDMVLNRYDVIVHPKYDSIINKIIGFNNITDLYLGNPYRITTNDKRLTANPSDLTIECYVSQQKGYIKYIKKSMMTDYNFYKVITPRANGSNSCFGNIVIVTPKQVFTESYIAFDTHTKERSDSFESYLKCRLPNFMLSLRKIAQSISESTCKWIPLPPLDRVWTDDAIYKYFKLTAADIELIENTKLAGYDK